MMIGDCIYARGEVGEENELIVDKTWANIGSLAGEIQAAARTQIVVRLSNGESKAITEPIAP